MFPVGISQKNGKGLGEVADYSRCYPCSGEMNPGGTGGGGGSSLNALAAVPWKDGFTFPFGVPLGTSGLQQPRDPPAGGEMPSHGEGNGRTDIVFTSA